MLWCLFCGVGFEEHFDKCVQDKEQLKCVSVPAADYAMLAEGICIHYIP